jgi:hypothetical protein
MNSASFAEHVADKPLPLEKPTVTKHLSVTKRQIVEAINYTYPDAHIPADADVRHGCADSGFSPINGISIEWTEQPPTTRRGDQSP